MDLPLSSTVPATRAPATPGAPTAAAKAAEGREAALREAAHAFEAVFLAEMLKHSGINKAPGGFDGGAGEDAFSGFLTEEYARLIADRGGIGLAEHIFGSLMQGGNAS